MNFKKIKFILHVLLCLALCTSTLMAKTIFSPNGDNINDNAVFRLNISTAKEDIASWKFEINNIKGKLVKTFEGQGPPPEKLKWDGRNENKVLVKGGVYDYIFSIITNAGNKVKLEPQEIVVDYVKPVASITTDLAIFSPNADGIKDEVIFTQESSDLNGINSWLITIEDKDGNPVKSFSGTGNVKPSIIWDGKENFGDDAPDGTYTYYLTVQDNAGNRFSTEKKTVRLMREAQVSSLKVEPKVFSPNEDNQKDALEIKIFAADSSNVEAWNLSISNSLGKAVKRVEGKGDPPRRIIWDGKDEKDKTVSDGTYALVLSETDNAGNTVSTMPVAFDVDNSPPVCRLSLENKVFSPNGDKLFEKARFSFKITDSHFIQWRLSIQNSIGKIVRTLEGKGENPDKEFIWNGKDDQENEVMDGVLTYFVDVIDIADNKYITPKQNIQIDRLPPVITAKAEPTLFSPNSDGVMDDTSFTLQVHDASPIDKWMLELKDSTQKVVKSFEGIGNVKENIIWKGKGNERNILPDGTYLWTLYAVDIVGNGFKTEPQKITIGATKPSISISSDLDVFSPNADGYKDSVKFSLSVEAFNKIKQWNLKINSGLDTLRTFSGFGAPPGIVGWGGENDDKRPIDDGRYKFVLEVVDEAGNRVESVPQNIVIDTTKPKLLVSVRPKNISPNDDQFKDTASFSLNYVDESACQHWELIVEDKNKEVLRKFSGSQNPPQSVVWDGKDKDNNLMKDDVYKYMFIAKDIVGNQKETPRDTIQIDTTPPDVELTADPTLFSPNADGDKDTTEFLLQYKDVSDISEWILEAIGPEPARRTFKGKGRPSQNIIWDGKNDRGSALPDGLYKTELRVTDEVGNTGKSKPVNIEVDTSKPIVTVLTEEEPIQSLAPSYTFNETKRGVVISLAAELLFDTGKAELKQTATATLNKIINLIKKHSERKVNVEGHTDNVPIHKEEFPNNQVLSEKRAESVVNYFAAGGVPKERFVMKGFGQTKPVASNETAEGRRKNRRVEIILLKE